MDLKPHSLLYYYDHAFIFIFSLSTSLPNSHFLSLQFQNPRPSDSLSQWVPKVPPSLVIYLTPSLQYSFPIISCSSSFYCFRYFFCFLILFSLWLLVYCCSSDSLIDFQLLWIYNLEFLTSIYLCWNSSRVRF